MDAVMDIYSLLCMDYHRELLGVLFLTEPMEEIGSG